MIGSAMVYIGLLIAATGLTFVAKPIHALHVSTRSQGLAIVGLGLLLTGIGLTLPIAESRLENAETRLDEFFPVWQFSERHSIAIDAPPTAVFDAMKQVRADEIFLYRTLTWIRRGGRPIPESILNAGDRASLIDAAVKGGFLELAEDSPRELVIGTVLAAPAGAPRHITPAEFRTPLAPGYSLAALNFFVRAEGPNKSVVTTETRVFANSPEARGRFARYWRVIYPGSAIIRRMWLRAVRRRAMNPAAR